MAKRLVWLVCIVLASFLACRRAPTPTPTPTPAPIARRVPPLRMQRGPLAALPALDPAAIDPQVDLRGYDVSALELRPHLQELLHATFDRQTVWPPADRLPQGFDPETVMALGRNPGLGVRALHAQGITGRGVSVAIIDQVLLTDHHEYAERIRRYEEIGVGGAASMHGAAVASILAGKTVGMAPEADVYYVARRSGGTGQVDHRVYAEAIRRVLEINQGLPADRKIRVISIQKGWPVGSIGHEEVMAASRQAKAQGMLVICSSSDLVHGFRFDGLGRSPLADPDRTESYEPRAPWPNYPRGGLDLQGCLLVPMDSRATAGPAGPEDYAFYRYGGWSWATPYIAGLYALAVQVDPQITPDRFWALALETGRTIQIQHEGQTRSFGPIVDPGALIAAERQG